MDVISLDSRTQNKLTLPYAGQRDLLDHTQISTILLNRQEKRAKTLLSSPKTSHEILSHNPSQDLFRVLNS